MSEELRTYNPNNEPGLTLRAHFSVRGMPGPQGSKRHVGKGKMVESSAKVAPWRECVKWEALSYRNRNAIPVLTGPVFMRIVFTLPKPVSAPKRRRTFPDRKPDLDKLERSTLDALTDAGMWQDDSQVVEFLRSAKVYPNEDPEALESPGVHLSIFTCTP